MKKITFLITAIVLTYCNLATICAAFCPSTPSTPYTQHLTNIAVTRALPVGSDIPGTQRSFTFSGNCKNQYGTAPVTAGHPIVACYYGSGSEVSGFPGVYETGVEGIGIAIQNGAGHRVRGAGPLCDSRVDALGYVSTDAARTFNYMIQLSLVKTAATTRGGTLNVAQTKFGMGAYNTAIGIGNNGPQNYIGYAGDVISKVVSCTVPSILNINLGTIPVNQFTGPGSTSSEQHIDIPVSCDDAVNVSTLVSSQRYLSTNEGVIALTSGSGVAQGVGVQVLYHGNPAQFDTWFPVGRITAPGSSITLPFAFRYYQNTPVIVPGRANAVATLTMMYN